MMRKIDAKQGGEVGICRRHVLRAAWMAMPLRRHESKKTFLDLLCISCMKWPFVVVVVFCVFVFLFFFVLFVLFARNSRLNVSAKIVVLPTRLPLLARMEVTSILEEGFIFLMIRTDTNDFFFRNSTGYSCSCACYISLCIVWNFFTLYFCDRDRVLYHSIACMYCTDKVPYSVVGNSSTA
jgi:hypothetical protein